MTTIQKLAAKYLSLQAEYLDYSFSGDNDLLEGIHRRMFAILSATNSIDEADIFWAEVDRQRAAEKDTFWKTLTA